MEHAMTQLAARLTVASADLPLPVRFGTPFGTIAFKITKAVLYIYVEANCHPLDWDVAAGLMARIAARPRVASWLAHLDEWMVEQVSCAAQYLT